MTDPLGAAIAAHEAALAAQQAQREASYRRDRAVKAARDAGVSTSELVTALGVNRQRIHHMLKNQESAND